MKSFATEAALNLGKKNFGPIKQFKVYYNQFWLSSALFLSNYFQVGQHVLLLHILICSCLLLNQLMNCFILAIAYLAMYQYFQNNIVGDCFMRREKEC